MAQDAQTPSTSKFSIVRAISAFLKLGDDGKLDSFFTRVAKTLSKEAQAHKKNLDNLKFNHDQEIDRLNDSLEDANSALEEAYLKVDIERIGNNASQQEYQNEYLENIDNHILAVQSVEKQIEQENKEYEEKVAKTQKLIDSLNKRITKISAE